MPNPMFNPQPNYSGVTIQITNPTVNAGNFPPPNKYAGNGNYITCPQACCCPPQYYVNDMYTDKNVSEIKSINDSSNVNKELSEANNPNSSDTLPQTYPAQYYLNNYNYQGKDPKDNISETESISKTNENYPREEYGRDYDNNSETNNPKGSALRHYDDGKSSKQTGDLSISQGIAEDLDAREAEIKAKKENMKETKIVALTDEYIKSLENYLNNPNSEIRLMASKEILTRLDEDKDRYNDAALNALLNKMLQDPSKLIRVAALSAFASGLACGNDYTVQLLHNIQSNPSADKEDVLQAADILLKMSAGTEVKNIPTPSNNEVQQQK